jgi:Cft2 family RNA processing exonuclease
MRDIRPEVMDGKKVRDFKPRKGEIYLISSGMMTEKTLSNVLGQRFLTEERHSIFFVGYCDPESPAGRLLQTPRGHKVTLDEKAGEQPALCRVAKFDLTAHAQREDTLNYILKADPRVCILVHGDQPALAWFQERLNTERPGMKIIIPPPGVAVEV